MSTVVAAWRAAEELSFQYLVTKLEGIEGVTAYLPDQVPTTLSASDNASWWWFEINGGDNAGVHIRPGDRPWGSWYFDAALNGLFEKRATALDVAGMAMAALPAGETDIAGVGRLDWTTMPRITRTSIMRDPDGSAAGEARIWALEFPLVVLFHNQEYA